MRISNSQLNLLAAAAMDRVRRERILALRDQGFNVTENASERSLLVRDAAGGTARVESRGLRCRVTSAEGRQIETEQYPGGRVRSISDPSGREVHFERDSDGFLRSIDRGPGGGTYHFKLSQQWQPLRIEYPDGTSSVAEYSPIGQPTRIIQRDRTFIRYEYAAGNGKLASLIDPQGHRTRLLDQGAGTSRVIEYPNGDRHAYLHDIDARLLRFEVNGKGQAQYQHDPESGSIEARYHNGGSERFKFNNGRVVEATNEHSTVKLQYDEAGRLLSEEADGKVVQYLRNEVGALIGIVTPDGDTVSYTRDRDQRLTGIVDWSGGRYETLLPPSGPPSEIRYPNGLTVATKTNAMGLPSNWSVYRSAAPSEQVDAASWEHDLCDRLTMATHNGQRREYQYTNASRLVQVRCSDRRLAERFELDSRGNRSRSATGQCSHDPMNRLLRAGSREFSYDGLGNQTADHNGPQSSTYTYNGRGQLIGIRSRSLATEYVYDALGRRIRKRVGGVTTHFQWAGTRVISETTDDGMQVVRRDYLFCPEFLTPLAFREGASVYYMHCGRLHEPLCVTNGGGQVVWKAEYLAFGRALISVNQVHQPWRLPGQYCDAETDLHYSVARYYAPELGRYLSMDPRRVPGASLNYYIYCDGDPVNRVDPTGEISLTLGTVLVAVGVGIAIGAAIGAGIELYRERNQEHTDWGQVGTAALIGGALGGIGAAVGAVAAAATVGTLGVIGAGAAAGGLGAAVEYCVQAVGQNEWNWSEFGTSVAVGAGIGAVTAGVGGIIAARAARRAAREAAEIAAREAEERAAREAAERAAREAAERTTREASEKSAREALEKAAREATETAASDSGTGELTKAGRSLTKHASGQRFGSKAFPEIEGGPRQINEQASKILDDMINDPNKIVKIRPGKGGEQILQVSRPDGTGAIFKMEGGQWTFSHFAESLY